MSPIKAHTNILKLIQHVQSQGTAHLLGNALTQPPQPPTPAGYHIPPEQLYAGDMVWADSTAIENLALALADLAQESVQDLQELYSFTAYRETNMFGRPLLHDEYNSWLESYLAEGGITTPAHLIYDGEVPEEHLAYEQMNMRYVDNADSLPALVCAVTDRRMTVHILVSPDIDLNDVPVARLLNNSNIQKQSILAGRYSYVQLYGWVKDTDGTKKPVAYPSAHMGGVVPVFPPGAVASKGGFTRVAKEIARTLEDIKALDSAIVMQAYGNYREEFDDVTSQLTALTSTIQDGYAGWRAADVAAYREWVTDRLKLLYVPGKDRSAIFRFPLNVYSCNTPGKLNHALEGISEKTPKGTHYGSVVAPVLIVAKPGVADLNKISFPHRNNLKREYTVCGWGNTYPLSRRLRHYNAKWYNPDNISVYPNLLSSRSLKAAFKVMMTDGWVAQQFPPHHPVFQFMDNISSWDNAWFA
jgi:hypothetical protein